MRGRTILACAVLAAAITVSAVASAGAANKSGFKTSKPSMLTAVMNGVSVTPLMTVGDVLGSGYRFESIPDGISVRTRGNGRVDLFVNHETGRVPFPFVLSGPNVPLNENDFDNAQVSRLALNRHSAGVMSGKFVIPSSFGYQRFCSNYLATAKEGFSRNILFTNEESPDYVFRQEDSWPPPIGDPAEREAGLVVALDVRTGKHHPIYGMGRHNHENSVAIPGYGHPVVLSGDDTFTSGPMANIPVTPAEAPRPAQSQLYSYIASSTDDLLADKGDLWAFVSDTPGVSSYYDIAPGSTAEITGHFEKVPKDIATGLNPDGSEMKAADQGYPLPPNNISNWQTDLRSATPLGIDGPQWVLQRWSDLHNVFQFVRVEDVAYDKRPGKGNVVYIVDSGRGRASASDTAFPSSNGRVWKMVLDPDNPTKVTSMSVFVEGDNNTIKDPGEIHQPDNIETTQNGLLVTEDPGSSQHFDPPETNATTARLWHVPFAGAPQIVAKVDQSADGQPGRDVDGRANAKLGAWETTGIVDASKAFGSGAFLINVQAHSLWVEKAPGEVGLIAGQPDFTFKREGGQLALIRIPGG
jgi:hypothetical protein